MFDLEKELKRDDGRGFISMKSILIAVLLSAIVLIGGSSCVTVSREPLASGEVRLLSMDVVGAGVEANSAFAVNVFFEAAGNPEIKRACFYEQGEKPSCFDLSVASYTTLGTKRAFQVYLLGIGVGSHRMECYAEYIRGGETQKTNVIFTQIIAGTDAS